MIQERDQFPPTPEREPFVDPDPTLDGAAMARALREEPLQEEDEEGLRPAAGLEECTPEDFQIPALKIRQSATQGAERVPEGYWFLTEPSERATPSRRVVVLEVRKERSLLLPWGDRGQERAVVERIRQRTGVQVPEGWEGPVCYSRDRVRPVTSDRLLPLASECEVCPMARWRTDRGRRHQDCAESYRVLLLDVTSELPAVYYARGAAIRPTRELLTRLQVACRRDGVPTCAYRVTASTERLEGEEGPYWVPRFDEPIPLEDEELIAQYAEIRRVFSTWPAEGAA